MTAPLLSFIVDGRNDAFMGNFLWRAAVCANILGRSVAALNRAADVELVVCDWDSEVPLSQALPLGPAARRIARFVSIPRSATAAGDAQFPDVILTNAGVRRAKGEFACWIGFDVIVLPASLHALLAVLERRITTASDPRRSFLVAGRRHVPTSQTRGQPRLEEFEAYCVRNAAFFPAEMGGVGHAAPTNLMGAHRSVWHSCRGFDETLVHWGWGDIDLALRLSQQVPLLNLDHYGVNLLHLEHWAKPRDYSPEAMHRPMNPVTNLCPTFAPNGDDWGLGRHELAESAGTGDVAALDPVAVAEPDISTVGSDENLGTVRGVMGHFLHLPIPLPDVMALAFLTWAARRRAPMRYTEIGFRYPHAVAAVNATAPGCELQAVTAFEHRADDEQIFYARPDTSLMFYVTRTLAEMGCRQFTRFLRGDLPGTVDELEWTDLALVRAEAAYAAEQAAALAPLVRHALVVTSGVADGVARIADAVSGGFQWLARSKDGLTAVLVKGAA